MVLRAPVSRPCVKRKDHIAKLMKLNSFGLELNYADVPDPFFVVVHKPSNHYSEEKRGFEVRNLCIL